MAQIPYVQPGEVIRASLINGLIDAVNAGGGPGPGVAVPDVFGQTLAQARTAITQPSVNLLLGTTLDTFGVFVDPDASLSAARLVISQSPAAGTRAAVGSRVNLVLAAQGSTTPSLGGQVDVTYDSMSPTTPTAGQPLTLRYLVSSRANQAASFSISKTVVVASNQAVWNAVFLAAAVLDDANQPLSGGLLPVGANQSQFVKIRIASVPADPLNAAFTPTVGANAAGVTTHPDVRTFTVGTAPPPQDNSITFEIVDSSPPAALVGGTTVQLASGGAAKINCRATFTIAGTYEVSAALLSGTDWTVERNSVTTPASYPPFNTVPVSRNPEFIVRAGTNPSAIGSIELRLKRQGQTSIRTRVLNLSL